MNWSERLEKEGYGNDLCMKAIMDFMSKRENTKLHKDDLARIPFKAWKVKKNDWEKFSIDTVLRKTRALAAMGLLDKDNLGSKHSTRYWLPKGATGQIQPPRYRMEVVETPEGRVARPVLV